MTVTATMHKPRLSFWQLWNMSFGFLGIQFGFALQNANVSRIFQTLGAKIDDIPILWIAAPITGFLVQPIIGYLSDRTWHPRWGRRRPFFFFGAVLASMALFFMPKSSALWVAAGLLWIMPYFFTNTLGIPNTAAAGIVPDSVKYSFFVGAVVFLGSVLWTVLTTKEFPPEDIKTWEEEKLRKSGIFHGIVEITEGILKMPQTMLQLAAVQFFTWLAFFSMWIYTTASVAQNIYHTSDTTSKNFQDAGDWVGVMFMVYNGVSAIVAFLLPMLAKRIGRKFTHLSCLLVGGVGLASIFFISDKNMLLFPMIGVGLAWASTLTMPYAILSGALPPSKMGFYMGVFNFFIVIPQILAAAILGFFVRKVFHDQSIYALVVGGIAMIIAAFLNFIVNDKDDKKYSH